MNLSLRLTASVVLVALLCSVPSARAQCRLAFAQPTSVSAVSGRAVVVADFNGDGKADLALASDNHTSIMLGNGDGTFQSAVNYGYGGGFVAAADLNGDGKLDLVVGGENQGVPNTVTILRGLGNGAFQIGIGYVVGAVPTWAAVGDFDGDGRLDIVATVANSTGNSFALLRGNGDGTFQPAASFAIGVSPTGVVAADLSGDGRLDVAASGSAGVSVVLGAGGAFFSPVVYSTGGSPKAVAATDFDRNGSLDLAVVNSDVYSSSVSVLLNNGNGTYQAARNFPVGSNPVGLAVADINGDGQMDIATVNSSGCPVLSTVSVMLGDGTGRFPEGGTYGVATCARGLAVGDLNGDNRPDVVIVGDNVFVMLNLTPRPPSVVQQPSRAVVTAGASAQFTIQASGDGPLAYRWRRDGVVLTDGPLATGATVTGSITPSITVAGVSLADDASSFDCAVLGQCGSVYSAPAGLRVGSSCAADFDGDGHLQVQDIFAFLNTWFAGCP